MRWLDEYQRLLRDPAPEAFQQAVDLKARHRPQSVFKYRVVSDQSLDSLRRSFVWLSHPRSFNDGYDSAMVVDYDRCAAISFRRDIRKTISERDLADRFSEADVLSIAHSDTPERTFFKLLMQKDGTWAGSHSEAMLDALFEAARKVREGLEKATFEMARDGILACCFSESGTLPALWAYYAGENAGFCIEYDLAQLPPDDIRLRLLVPVIYGSAPADGTFAFEAALLNGPNPLTVRWPLVAASHKDQHWSHEREWRLIDPAGPQVDGRAVPMPMKAVYLGVKITPAHAAEVTQAAGQHGIPVLKMQVGRDASNLTFVPAAAL